MFNKSIFMSHLKSTRVAGLEMEANDPVKPVGPAVVANVDPIPAEKAGFVSDTKGEDQNLEISKTTEIGTEPDFDKQQEDYVEMGQEEGLALEHIHSQIRSHLNRKWALEDIAEIAQSTLDGEAPVENVEAATVTEPGISPEAAMMVTRALDMDELADEESTSVAIESFEFSRVAATESFVDRVMNKATKSGGTAGRYLNALVSKLQNGAQRIGSRLKEIGDALDSMQEDMQDVNSSGVVITDPKAVNRIVKRVRGSSSARDPYDALVQSEQYFREALKLATSGHSDLHKSMQSAIDSKEADKIYAAANATLAFAKKFEKLANTPYADAAFTMSVDNVGPSTKPKTIKVNWNDSPASEFKTDRIAALSDRDIVKATELVRAADSSINAKAIPLTIRQHITSGVMTVLPGGHHISSAYENSVRQYTKTDIPEKEELSRTRHHNSDVQNAIRVAQAVSAASYDAVWGTIYNLGDGVIDNGIAVRQWGMETLSLGRRGRGSSKAE